MANQVIISYDTGNTITAAVYSSVGTLITPAPTVTESPAGSGRYVYTFPAGPADTYLVNYTSGGYLIGADTIVWDGSGIASNDVTTISANVSAIKAKTDTLGSLTVSVTAPVATDGSLTLVQGDDYLGADGRAISFTITNPPTLTGATVKLNATHRSTLCVQTLSTGSVSGSTVNFDVTHTTTGALQAGDPSYEYSVVATLSDGSICTLATGTLLITN